MGEPGPGQLGIDALADLVLQRLRPLALLELKLLEPRRSVAAILVRRRKIPRAAAPDPLACRWLRCRSPARGRVARGRVVGRVLVQRRHGAVLCQLGRRVEVASAAPAPAPLSVSAARQENSIMQHCSIVCGEGGRHALVFAWRRRCQFLLGQLVGRREALVGRGCLLRF